MYYIKQLFAILTCFSCLINNAIAADTRKLEVHFIDSVQSTDVILIDFGTTEIYFR